MKRIAVVLAVLAVVASGCNRTEKPNWLERNPDQFQVVLVPETTWRTFDIENPPQRYYDD